MDTNSSPFIGDICEYESCPRASLGYQIPGWGVGAVSGNSWKLTKSLWTGKWYQQCQENPQGRQQKIPFKRENQASRLHTKKVESSTAEQSNHDGGMYSTKCSIDIIHLQFHQALLIETPYTMQQTTTFVKVSLSLNRSQVYDVFTLRLFLYIKRLEFGMEGPTPPQSQPFNNLKHQVIIKQQIIQDQLRTDNIKSVKN